MFSLVEIVETTTEPPTETSTASPSFPVDSSATSTTYKDCEADGSGDFDVFSDRHGAFLQGQNRIGDKRKSFTVKHRLPHSRGFKHAELVCFIILFITFRMLILSFCFHSSIASKTRKPMKYKLLLKLPLARATNNRFPPFCRKLMEAQVTKKWQNVSH